MYKLPRSMCYFITVFEVKHMQCYYVAYFSFFFLNFSFVLITGKNQKKNKQKSCKNSKLVHAPHMHMFFKFCHFYCQKRVAIVFFVLSLVILYSLHNNTTDVTSIVRSHNIYGYAIPASMLRL